MRIGGQTITHEVALPSLRVLFTTTDEALPKMKRLAAKASQQPKSNVHIPIFFLPTKDGTAVLERPYRHNREATKEIKLRTNVFGCCC
jgi:hypothetical protein